MTGWIHTDPLTANHLKVGGCAMLNGRVYRCVTRARLIRLADVETGALLEVPGTTAVVKAVPAERPGVVLGWAPGEQTTVAEAPAGARVLITHVGRWELATICKAPRLNCHRTPRRGLSIRVPWKRTPDKIAALLSAPCWLAVQVAEVATSRPAPLEPAPPPPPKKKRPAPREPRPWRRNVVGARPVPKAPKEPRKRPAPPAPRVVTAVVVRNAPLVDVPPPPPVAPPLPAPLPPTSREWHTLKRWRNGRQETLFFETREAAERHRLRAGSEQPILMARGTYRVEPTGDGLMRAVLPVPMYGGKPINVKKVRLPYKDDDEEGDP